MDIRDAIETVEYARAFNTENTPLMIALNTVIDAAAKQIPVTTVGWLTDYQCGICGRRVRSGNGSSSLVRDNYCQKCGQKLRWEGR